MHVANQAITGQADRLKPISYSPKGRVAFLKTCLQVAQYTMYGQALQHRRRALRTQSLGEWAILAHGFVTARSCRTSYT